MAASRPPQRSPPGCWPGSCSWRRCRSSSSSSSPPAATNRTCGPKGSPPSTARPTPRPTGSRPSPPSTGKRPSPWPAPRRWPTASAVWRSAVQASGVDSAEYAQVEASLRPFFSRYLRDFGFTDLFLVATDRRRRLRRQRAGRARLQLRDRPLQGHRTGRRLRTGARQQGADARRLRLLLGELPLRLHRAPAQRRRRRHRRRHLRSGQGTGLRRGRRPRRPRRDAARRSSPPRREDAVVVVAPARFDDDLPKARRIGAGAPEGRSLQAALEGQAGNGDRARLPGQAGRWPPGGRCRRSGWASR